MLKVRLQGTRADIDWFCELLKSNKEIEVVQFSDIYSNKGTSRYYRKYAEIQKLENMEDKEYV